MRPHLLRLARPGFEPDEAYVRRWWTCVLGPTAVADLLRLVRAAELGEAIPRPVGLTRLVAAGLALRHGSAVVIPLPIPPVGDRDLGRIPHHLRAAHRRDLEAVSR